MSIQEKIEYSQKQKPVTRQIYLDLPAPYFLDFGLGTFFIWHY